MIQQLDQKSRLDPKAADAGIDEPAQFVLMAHSRPPHLSAASPAACCVRSIQP